MNLFLESVAHLLRTDRVFAWAFIFIATAVVCAYAALIDLAIGKLLQLVKGSRV